MALSLRLGMHKLFSAFFARTIRDLHRWYKPKAIVGSKRNWAIWSRLIIRLWLSDVNEVRMRQPGTLEVSTRDTRKKE